jgi:hypothetical protein
LLTVPVAVTVPIAPMVVTVIVEMVFVDTLPVFVPMVVFDIVPEPGLLSCTAAKVPLLLSMLTL